MALPGWRLGVAACSTCRLALAPVDQEAGRDSVAVPEGLEGVLAASAPEAVVLTVGGIIQHTCAAEGSCCAHIPCGPSRQ